MKEKQLLEKGLADLAYKAEADHEVQMARAELYKIAKYAIKMHEMLKGVSEAEGLEGWVQSKITKAADYMNSVYSHMDYETQFEAVREEKKIKDIKADESNFGSSKKKESIDPYKESLAAKLESKKKTFELDKKTIKQAHKTADKIKDKPEAKKSIGKWAKEKGMDPEGAIYAIATNMAKKK